MTPIPEPARRIAALVAPEGAPVQRLRADRAAGRTRPASVADSNLS